MSADGQDTRARRNVVVLVAAQALLGSQMPMIFIIGGLAGQSLASNICFATLPISLIVLGSMLSATPISAIMQKFGRRTGFFLGALALDALASLVVVLAALARLANDATPCPTPCSNASASDSSLPRFPLRFLLGRFPGDGVREDISDPSSPPTIRSDASCSRNSSVPAFAAFAISSRF